MSKPSVEFEASQPAGTALARTPPSATALARTPPNPSYMSLIEQAVSKGADINTIERLVAVQEKMLAREAEAEFNAAMNRAQEGMKLVCPDSKNPQTKSEYASYAALDKMIRPIYTKEGFSPSFDTDVSPLPDHIRVYCYCGHSGGHTRTYKVDMPADGKGAKGGDVMTKTHAAGAAMTYGMRYLLKFIFNIAIGADDTDGNTASGMSPERIEELCEFMANSSADELKKYFAMAWNEAEDAHDKTAQAHFVQAKDARKKELGLK